MRAHDSSSLTYGGTTASRIGALATLPGDSSEPAPEHAPEEPPVPERFGRFAVRGILGRGGMSTVLEARDERLDREIALKVLHQDSGLQQSSRLVREAKALARLSHPNVVQVYEVGEVDGQSYIAMQLIRGRTLQQWQASRPPWRDCVAVYVQAGRGLAAAHAVGLVHRDFKPSNCIIDDEGQVRVLDFGLARGQLLGFDDEADSDSDSDSDRADPQLVSSLTQTGAVLGTLAYMPLEQLDGAQVDERSDQFSLCVSIYEAVYGERPFDDAAVGRLTSALMDGAIRPPPAGTVVPARLRRILLRGLAIEPDHRWPSVSALLDELERLIAPRRARSIALTLGVGLAVAGGLVWRSTHAAAPCQYSKGELLGVWDAERRGEVEAALRATDVPYIDNTSTEVRNRLDAYAEHWVEQHQAACEATLVRGVQTESMMNLRMACLRTRQIAMREAVDVLAQADATVAEQAVDIAAQLPALDRCADEHALSALLAPPDDPHTAQRVDQLREHLAEINALTHAHRFEDASRQVDTLIDDAERLDYGPLLAEASLARGELWTRMGKFDQAEPELTRAYALAVEHGHERVAATATLDLTFLVGGEQVRSAEGRQWGTSAMAYARRQSPRTQADVLNALGLILLNQGEYAEALDHHQRALAMREEDQQPDTPEVAKTHAYLGRALWALGRHHEAHAHLQHALAIQEEIYGAEHPQASLTLLDLGTLAGEQGQIERSLEHYLRAKAIQEKTVGLDHPMAAKTFGALGVVYRQLDRPDEARDAYARALTLSEAALGPTHPTVASVRINLGTLLSTEGLYQEALDQYHQAHDPMVASVGEEHPHIATLLDNMGAAMQGLQDYEGAQAYHRKALGMYRRVLGVDHPSTSRSMANLALTLREPDDLDERLDLQGKALARLEAHWGADHPMVASAMVYLATTECTMVGQAEDGLARAERAVAIIEAGEPDAMQLATSHLALAQCVWEQEPPDQERVYTLLDRAWEHYARMSEKRRRRGVERMNDWLADREVLWSPPTDQATAAPP